MSKLPPLAIVAVLVALVPSVASDPKPDAKEKAAQEKAVKELIDKAVTAVGKQDIDALLDMSDVPWSLLGTISDDKVKLKTNLRAGFDEKPVFDAKYALKSIETFKAARTDLLESEVKTYQKILAETDLLVHVEIAYPAQKKIHARLLIKFRDGMPRLVGIDKESRV